MKSNKQRLAELIAQIVIFLTIMVVAVLTLD